MDVATHYALKAIMRGLVKSGALTIAQLQEVFYELEDAAMRLEAHGEPANAALVRDLVNTTFEGGRVIT